nr:TolC family protein [uncultured Polynucleobacter sp.]
MKKLIFLVAGFIAFQAHANSVWLEQNKLVGEIGGWKVYAKEQPSSKGSPNQVVFTLNQAIEYMLRNQLDSVNYLPGSESIADYYLLSHAQRSALQQRYSIIYETSKAYYELVAQREKLVHMEDVLDAVEAASELTSRMYQVGNVSELKLLKQKKDLYKKRLEYKAVQAKYFGAKERFIQKNEF